VSSERVESRNVAVLGLVETRLRGVRSEGQLITNWQVRRIAETGRVVARRAR
jgi:hypothetical protein